MRTEINGKTGILGIIGGNIETSLSPFLHNELLKHYSLNERYLPFQISMNQLQIVIEWMKALNVKEMNVTAPFKEKIFDFMDSTDESAFRVGAMNTIVNKNGILYGYNTDLIGFKRSLLEGDSKFEIDGKNAVVLGAGGAARAVVYVLCQEGIKEISIFNRTLQRAEKIKQEYQVFFPDCHIRIFPIENGCLQNKINRTDLLINTTPVGSHPNTEINPLPENIQLNQHLLAYDLIYFPEKTYFLKQAEKARAKTLNGNHMLVYQAVESFYLWTGIQPDKKIVKKLIYTLDHKNKSKD